MRVFFTGERLQNLGGFKENDLHLQIKDIIKKQLLELKSNKNLTILTKLNIGIETWSAKAALELDIPYQVYVPFDDMGSKWPKHVKMEYLYLLKKAKAKEQLDTGEFHPKKLHDADVHIIKNSDLICTFFNMDPPIMKFIEREKVKVIDLMPKSEEVTNGLEIPF